MKEKISHRLLPLRTDISSRLESVLYVPFFLYLDTFLYPYLLSRSPVYLIPRVHAYRCVSDCEVVLNTVLCNVF